MDENEKLALVKPGVPKLPASRVVPFVDLETEKTDASFYLRTSIGIF